MTTVTRSALALPVERVGGTVQPVVNVRSRQP
jgi:hypothetical protein